MPVKGSPRRSHSRGAVRALEADARGELPLQVARVPHRRARVRKVRGGRHSDGIDPRFTSIKHRFCGSREAGPVTKGPGLFRHPGTRSLTGSCTLPPGSRVLPSGSRVLPSGSRVLRPGSRVLPPGSRVLPAGITDTPVGITDTPAGITDTPASASPGSRVLPSGSRVLPSGSRVLPSGSRVLPSGSRDKPGGRTDDPVGIVGYPGEVAAEVERTDASAVAPAEDPACRLARIPAGSSVITAGSSSISLGMAISSYRLKKQYGDEVAGGRDGESTERTGLEPLSDVIGRHRALVLADTERGIPARSSHCAAFFATSRPESDECRRTAPM